MVRVCAHRDCKLSERNKEDGVKFHPFPRDEEAFQQWLRCCGLTSPRDAAVMYLCSKHFVGGMGPTAAHPNPKLYEKPAVTPAASPCLSRKFKKKNRPEAVIPRTALAPDDSMWQTTSIITVIGEDGKDSVTLTEKGQKFVTLLPQSPRGVRQQFVGLKRKVSSVLTPKKASFKTKQFPWALLSPSKKRFRTSDVESSLLGCDFLDDPDDPMAVDHASLPNDSSVQGDSSVNDATTSTTSRVRRSLNLHLNSTKLTQDENNNSGSETRRKDVGIQCELGLQLIYYEKCKLMPEKHFKFFTGVSQDVFEVVYDFVGGDDMAQHLKYEYNKKTPKKSIESLHLPPKDRLFLTLIRLRRGIPLKDLSILFGISFTQASYVFYTWIRLLSLQFQRLQNVMFTSAASQKNKPKCFEKFKNLRAIIDCFEIKIQRPWNYERQGNTYSHYKSCNTVKVLVAISCMGSISYVSECYEGAISDRQIVLQSGFLDELSKDDAIMADRGFNIEAECNEIDVDLIVPPFLGHRKKFSAHESAATQAIAKSRIHVERGIGKIRNYRLVRYGIPNTLLPLISDIVFVICCLINFEEPYF